MPFALPRHDSPSERKGARFKKHRAGLIGTVLGYLFVFLWAPLYVKFGSLYSRVCIKLWSPLVCLAARLSLLRRPRCSDSSSVLFVLVGDLRRSGEL